MRFSSRQGVDVVRTYQHDKLMFCGWEKERRCGCHGYTKSFMVFVVNTT